MNDKDNSHEVGYNDNQVTGINGVIKMGAYSHFTFVNYCKSVYYDPIDDLPYRLSKVFKQVVDVFNSDTQPKQGVNHTCFLTHFLWNGGMRHRSRVANE